jgi:hypothetical protein
MERGAMTAMIAVLSVFLFAMAVVVTEGGRKLSNISRAQDIASEAARAAAATLDIDSLAVGSPRIDVEGDRAEREAEAIVAAAGRNVTLVDFQLQNGATVVYVRVEVRGDSILPGFDITGTGDHNAEVIDPSTLGP